MATQAAPLGPAITWDFTPYTDGSPETRTVSLAVMFPRGSADAKPPSKSKTQSKRRACEQRAKKIKNRKRRAAAERKCRKRYPKKHRAVRTAAVPSAFSAGQCPTDTTWHFAAQVDYRDGPATHETTVTCGSGTQVPSGGQQPGGALCIPPLPCPGRTLAISDA